MAGLGSVVLVPAVRLTRKGDGSSPSGFRKKSDNNIKRKNNDNIKGKNKDNVNGKNDDNYSISNSYWMLENDAHPQRGTFSDTAFGAIYTPRPVCS